MAFSLPKQQDDSAVSPCHGLGWSHHKQSGGQGSRPCRHHPAPFHHLPQGTTAQGAPLVFCTAAEAERQGANTAKTGGRKNQHISFYPGKETSLCSPKPSTLKLPRLQGGREVLWEGKQSCQRSPPTLAQATDIRKKTGEKEGREDSVTRLLRHNNSFM